MTSNLDYKKYSLDKLKEWVHDALSCGEASPHEIYSVIREAAREDYQYYKEHSARAFGLLELLSGHRPVADAWEEHYYPEEAKNHSESYYDYTRNDPNRKNPFEKKKWVLPVEEVKDEDSDENVYCVSFPDDLLEAAKLKEGDQVEWVDQGDGSYLLKKVEKPMSYDEAVAAGWTMTSDGIWWPPQDR